MLSNPALSGPLSFYRASPEIEYYIGNKSEIKNTQKLLKK